MRFARRSEYNLIGAIILFMIAGAVGSQFVVYIGGITCILFCVAYDII